MIISCKLSQFDLAQKKIFLRADLNVPLNNKSILDDFRLLAILPTIDFLLQKNAHIILATHLGRPEGIYSENLSTKILIPWFEKRGYEIHFTPHLISNAPQKNGIVLLENLRFFPGEQQHDPLFAQQLASLADFYVNDAFGVLHRNDTSITLVPQLFDENHRSIGLLIERELQALNKLMQPKHPFVAILGGGKVSSKLPLIYNLLNRIDTLLLCPALVFTFMKAMGYEVGCSLIEKSALNDANKILDAAQIKKVSLVFPEDFTIQENKKLMVIDKHNFSPKSIGVSIGPKTAQLFSEPISTAQTIFFNAAMGFENQPETLNELHILLTIVSQSLAFTVVGGGESVSAVRRFGLEKSIDFLSTGGGSTLAYISGEILPGLLAMQK